MSHAANKYKKYMGCFISVIHGHCDKNYAIKTYLLNHIVSNN